MNMSKWIEDLKSAPVKKSLPVLSFPGIQLLGMTVKEMVDSAENAQIVACSALLTTTMSEMKSVIEALDAAGIRNKVTVMIGGPPITQSYCDSIKADIYTSDAAVASLT